MSKLWFKLFLCCFIACSAIQLGCSPEGGAVGDANDPEVSGSDEEQMEDESGEMLPDEE